MAINFVTATPGLPNIFALGTSFFYLRMLDPVMNIIEAGGSGLDAILNLIPSESEILIWSAYMINKISLNYQVAWANSACLFIDLFNLPLKIGNFSINITGFTAKCLIKFINPIFGVGIPNVLDKIAKFFLSWS